MSNQQSRKEERETSFLNYCLTIAETSDEPESRKALIDDFFESNGIKRGQTQFNQSATKIIEKVRTGAYSLEVQAKLFFVTSTPISDEFLDELSAIATVLRDGIKRITSFESKTSNVNFRGVPQPKIEKLLSTTRGIGGRFQKKRKSVNNKKRSADKINENRDQDQDQDEPQDQDRNQDQYQYQDQDLDQDQNQEQEPEPEPEPTMDDNFQYEDPINQPNRAQLSDQTGDQEKGMPAQVENHDQVFGPSREDFEVPINSIQSVLAVAAQNVPAQIVSANRILAERVKPEKVQTGSDLARRVSVQRVASRALSLEDLAKLAQNPLAQSRLGLVPFDQALPNQAPSKETQLDQDPVVPAQEPETPLEQAPIGEAQIAQGQLTQVQRRPHAHQFFSPRASIQNQLDDDDENFENVYEDFFKGFYNDFLMYLNISERNETVEKLKKWNYEQKKILDPSLIKSYFKVHIGELICQKISNGDGHNLKKMLDDLLHFVKQSKPNPFLYTKLLPFVQKQIRRVSDEDTVSEELISTAIKGIVDGLELQSKEVNRRPEEIPVDVVNNNDNNTSPDWYMEWQNRQVLGNVVKKESRKDWRDQEAMEPVLKRIKREPVDSLSSWSPASQSLIRGQNAGGRNQMDIKPHALSKNIQDPQTPGSSDFGRGPLVQFDDTHAHIAAGPPALTETAFIRWNEVKREPEESLVSCLPAYQRIRNKITGEFELRPARRDQRPVTRNVPIKEEPNEENRSPAQFFYQHST